MQRLKKISEHFSIALHLSKWTFYVIPISVVIGSSVAAFLFLLDKATQLRWQNEWLIFLLPIAGVFIHFLYSLWGKNTAKGNNLLIDEIHKAGGGIPRRMAPLIFLSTIITHLFGGSAGREGTAVQMGGSIASMFGSWFGLKNMDMRIILTAGIAAGFSAVFGTPLTGTIFAMEVLTVGRIQYDALLPCLVASVIANMTCYAWGIHHTQYAILFSEQSNSFLLHIDLLLLLKVILAGICFGLCSFFFAEFAHRLKIQFNKIIKYPFLIPVIGGLLIIGLTYLVGNYFYLGLGVTTKNGGPISIVSSFHSGGADTWSWFWKIIFTCITISSGFKGGEVTPLFFIGATLGNTLAILLGAPVDLFAGLGFIAVFAGATNTPLACTIMGIELFGGEHALYFAIACFTAYFFSGNSGIYSSQKIAVPKIFDAHFSNETSLEELVERRKKYSMKSIFRRSKEE